MTLQSAAPAMAAPVDLLAPARRVPRSDRGIVRRPRLLAKLSAGPDVPLLLVVAPAGYGKTVLLADWARRDPRPCAWLSLAECPADPDAVAALLTETLASLDLARPFALVLDDVQRISSAEVFATLTKLAYRLGPGSVLALASRERPAMPIGRLRADRLVTEIGAQDLAMTAIEATMLLEAAGADPGRHTVRSLMERTEGWPAALYLHALALRGEPDDASLATADRLVAEYVEDTILAGLDARRAGFLRESSILDLPSGAACDAILGVEGSGELLAGLAAANVPIAPADGSRERFRCHPLLAHVMREQLARSDPRRHRELHRHAARWHAQHDDLGRAVAHAIAAGEERVATELTWAAVPEFLAHGRARELDELARGCSDEAAALPCARAAACFVAGDAEAAGHFAHAAQLPHGESSAEEVATVAGLLRAAVTPAPPEAMERAAAQALAALPEGSPWRSLCLLLMGTSQLLRDRGEQARLTLEEGSRAGAIVAPWAQVLCLAQLAIMAADRDDWEEAAARSYRARSLVQSARLTEYPIAALVYIVSAVAAAHRGQVEVAVIDAGEGRRLLDALGAFTPWYLFEAEVWLARTLVRLGDAAVAHELLDRARRRGRDMPGGGVTTRWLEDAARRLAAFSDGRVPSLTPAELRILGLLPSHLSFREIGEQLCVSTNTVKTQALSVYRKLDVTSRSDAVARARRLDLVGRGSSDSGDVLPRAPA